MLPTSPRLGALAAIILMASAGTASSQWLVTPPLDNPPAAQRPPEWLRREAPAPGTPATPRTAPESGAEENQAQPPATGCPYTEKKLELLV